MSHHDDTHDHDPGSTTQPGGGRQDATGTGSLGDAVGDPSHAAHPTDGAPSPGPQPGSTSTSDDDLPDEARGDAG